jgi:hypothetical protein
MAPLNGKITNIAKVEESPILILIGTPKAKNLER